MRALGTGNSAQILRRCSSNWIRVQIEDADGEMQTHAPYVIEYEDPSHDAPVGQATVIFRRRRGVESLAPLMSSNPPIDERRAIAIAIDAGSGSWTEVFRGWIDDVDWPQRDRDVTVYARDLMGAFVDQTIRVQREYGSAEGTPIEDVMQAIINHNWHQSYGPAPTLHYDAPTGAVVTDDPSYIPYRVSIFEALQHLADKIGAVLRTRNVAGHWVIGLVVPARSKTVPDHTFGPSTYFDVTQMRKSVLDVRTLVEVEYDDAEGTRRTVQYPPAEEVDAHPSVQRYGLRYLGILEGSDSAIRDAGPALELATAAHSDLSAPEAVCEIEAQYFWPGEVSVDLYRYGANGQHFSSDQDLAPIRIRHRLALNERPTSWIASRGKPSAGVLLWTRRARRQDREREIIRQYGFVRWEEVPHPTNPEEFRRWEYEAGGKVEDVYVAVKIFSLPLEETAETILIGACQPTGTTSGFIDLPKPRANQITLARAEPRYFVGNSAVVYDDGIELAKMARWEAGPAAANGRIDADDSDEDGSVDVRVWADPTPYALPVRWEVREGSRTGTLLASGTWQTRAEARAGATSSQYTALGSRSAPTVGKKTWFAKFTDCTGLETWASDAVGNPTVGGIAERYQFSTGLSPAVLVESLPSEGEFEGDTVKVISTDIAYIWRGGQWEVLTPTVGDFAYIPTLLADTVTGRILAAIEVEVGKEIRSTVYEEGVSGWRIDGEGNAELNSATIRGTLDGADGEFSGSLTAPVLEVSGTLNLLGGIPPNDTGLPTNAGVIQWGGIGGGARIMQDDSPRSIVFQLRDLTGDWYDVASLSAPTNPGETALSLRVNVGGTPEFRRVTLNGDALEAPEP